MRGGGHHNRDNNASIYDGIPYDASLVVGPTEWEKAHAIRVMYYRSD